MPNEQLTVTDQVLIAAKLEPDRDVATLAGDDAVGAYIEAAKLKDELETKLAELKRLASALEPVVVGHFQDQGTQRVTRNGRTIYLARELWPSIDAKDLISSLGDSPTKEQLDDARACASQRLVDALADDPETKHLVRASYNHQTLRSFILNDLEEGDDGMPVIPDHLKGKLGISEVFKAKVLKAS